MSQKYDALSDADKGVVDRHIHKVMQKPQRNPASAEWQRNNREEVRDNLRESLSDPETVERLRANQSVTGRIGEQKDFDKRSL